MGTVIAYSLQKKGFHAIAIFRTAYSALASPGWTREFYAQLDKGGPAAFFIDIAKLDEAAL
jgi:hypothetical protein